MAQCLKITLAVKNSKQFLSKVVQKETKKLGLEGVGHLQGDQLKIIVCGSRNAIDLFLDLLHKDLEEVGSAAVEIEPFIKEKDYRGVFRVIE